MTLIQRKDGTTYDLLDYGIRTRDLIISAPTPEHHTGKVEGTNGVVDYGTTYGPRDITGYYRAISHDFVDFSLLRDEIFHLFRTEESFYLIEKRQPGKRWLVKVANPYQIPQRNVYGNFEIQFIGIDGVSESRGTTQDIQRNGISADDELWGFGMGLLAVDDTLIYTHTDPLHHIYNAGNVEVHPYEQDLKITISDVVMRDGYGFFELANVTTGEAFRINQPVDNNEKIVLDGPNVTSNGLQIYRNTNRQFISLAPGVNAMAIVGADRARIEYDFRFYYK